MTKYREFIKANEEFVEKYQDVIYKMADYHGVDVGVGRDMLKTNLEFDKTIYEGGGVIPSEEWQQMLKDYKELKGIAIDSIKE